MGRWELEIPDKDARRLYGGLAWTWPIISPPEEYIPETEFFTGLIKEHSGREPATLLHLGCGGGHNDHTFMKHFDVTGVDRSPKMLELARSLNPCVTYLEDDMRTVRLSRRFDAVALLDSVNYMLTESDLEAAFATAYAHLGKGGVFITIVEQTRESFEQNKVQHLIRRRGDLEIAFVENMYDPDQSDTTYESVFIYLIRRGEGLEIEADRHLGGLFPLEFWYAALRSVGFTVKTTEYEDPTGADDIPVLVCIKETE
jgi:SAM-dependent methyltransferase